MQLEELGFQRNKNYFIYSEDMPTTCFSNKKEKRVYFAIRF
jgi:hypothetical protein